MSRPRFALAAAGLLAVGALSALPAVPAAAAPPPGAKDRVLSARLHKVKAHPHMTTREVAAETSTPSDGPGSLLKDDAGHYLVDIRVTRLTDHVVHDLSAAGAVVTHLDPEQRLVTAGVDPEDLDDVAAVSGVEYVADILTPVTHGACPTGIVTEGDAALRADTLRTATGVDGTGVRVGILSDSYDIWADGPTRAAGDVASADLPGTANPCGHRTPVSVADDSADPTQVVDEGRAMAQVVHDIAPGAAISFASAFTGQSAFAANIRSLAAAGADVLLDDVGYFDESFYQPGVIDNAIDDVTAAGVQYFSSAGNSNVVVGGTDVGSYESLAYRPATCPTVTTTPSAQLRDCHDFDPGPGTDTRFDLTVKPYRSFILDMQWAEPLHGVTQDLDLYLVDAHTGAVLEKSVDSNPDSGSPVEILGFDNASGSSRDLQIVVGHFTNGGPYTDPRLKFVFLGDPDMFSSVQPTTSPDIAGPTIFGHNGNRHAVTVAAQSVATATVDSYSSHGPVSLLFAPVAGNTPAPAIPEVVLAKPDLTASDCGLNTFFLDPAPPYRFCGTSAAAPHAAAVAALLHAARPGATPAQVLSALTSTASDRPELTHEVEGAGLVDADAARADLVSVVGSPSGQTITFAPAPTGLAATSTPLAATASSGLPVTLTVDPASSAICTLTGTTVRYLTNGSCTLHANQGGNFGYDAAPEVTRTIAIAKQNQVISFPAPAAGTVGGSALLAASASSHLAVTLAVDPASGAVCSLSGQTVRYLATGTCTLHATQAGSTAFNPAAAVTHAVSVLPPPPPAGSCAGRKATITGTSGNDSIRGTSGNDVIDARGGNDVVTGGGGNDLICGGGGSDRLAGNGGKDRLYGGAGRDSLNGGPGRDRCWGGAGKDTTKSC
ncbi:MAG TPA: S8 family serine peptidase [Sporichthya sp.]|nr:S8 family serine peptidase [Sporichthya sp.]